MVNAASFFFIIDFEKKNKKKNGKINTVHKMRLRTNIQINTGREKITHN